MRTFLTKLFISQSLEQVIDDLPELLARPAAVLARKEVRIGPVYWLAIISFFLGLMLPICINWITHSWDWRVELIGLAVGMVAAILIWLFSPRREIRLTADGVMFQDGRREVRCPWALFNTPGNPSLKDRWQLLLPVSPAAVPYVELRQDDCFRAQGAAVKTRFFRFVAGDAIWLRYTYEAHPAEVGELLLHLG